jgi:excinuclease ABC subunit C
LLDLCYKNIYEYAYKSHIDSLSTKWFTKQTMQNILDLLWFKKINKNIIFECNDISHISWNHTVASRSIIENWKSNTSKYKKFKIKTLEEQKIDDFWSMKEIITRRLKEIEKNLIIPDLIIIDGWKWQLNSVIQIIEEEKIKTTNKDFLSLLENLHIISIAKKEEEIFLPYQSEPIILDKKSSELRLIQKIRDEAHRFAINFNRDLRIKSMKKNILESLPWFWPKTRTKLLKKYWNIDNIAKISKEELLETINKTQLETLENHGII